MPVIATSTATAASNSEIGSGIGTAEAFSQPNCDQETERIEVRYFATAPCVKAWTLYWADRNSRWHRYDDLEPTTNLDDVLTEINEDPTCIFWG